MHVVCAYCKKEFYAGDYWHYRIRNNKTGQSRYFCRYNHMRKWEEERARRKPKKIQAKWVKCLNTGEVYPSAAAAAAHFNADPSAVQDACRIHGRTACGMAFAYVEDPG